MAEERKTSLTKRDVNRVIALTAGLVAGCVAVLVVLEKREREKEGA